MNFVIQNSYLIPLLPLIGAVLAGFFGVRYLRGKSHWPIWIGVGISAVLSLTLLFGMLGKVGGHEGKTGLIAPAGETGILAEPLRTATPDVDVQASMQNTVGVSHILFTWIEA